MPQVPAIEARSLSKSFPVATGWGDLFRPGRRERRQALVDVSFTLPTGRTLALLGANGAGKTTLIKILCTSLIADAGEAFILGLDLRHEAREAKRRFGLVVNEERSFYFRLSARQNLEFFAALWDLHGRAGRERVAAVLEIVGLSDRADDRFDRFSTGMRQRMAIARGLLMEPEILFLDEPTRSLDPVSADETHRFIREDLVRDRGKTAILASNSLEETEALADDLLVLREGRVVAHGTRDELAGGTHGRSRLLELLKPPGNRDLTPRGSEPA